MEKISWKTQEYLYTQKTSDWYWIVGIVTISIALIAIILNNVIFALLVIISSFTLSLFASKKPEVVEATVDSTGIYLGKNHYPYKELDSFWVETRDANPRIILKQKKIFAPFVVVFIKEISNEKVREALTKHLSEEEHTEPFLEKLLFYFGF